MIREVTFLHPELFWLFLLLPLAIAWQIWKRKEQSATLKISSVKGFKALGNQLTDKKLKVVSLKEALPYEETIEDVITEIEVEAEDVGPKNSISSDDEETQFTIDF